MNYRLNADEAACVKKLAERFERNEGWVVLSRSKEEPRIFVDPLELPAEKREAILGTMEHMGLITNTEHAVGCRFLAFRITPTALQVARAISEQENKEEEPRDIVEYVKTSVRRHRILAWVVIGFTVLTIVVTFVNQLLQLLKTLGVIKGT